MEPRDFLYSVSLFFINERMSGETHGLCLLGIVQVVRCAISSKVGVMAVARATVDDSREIVEIMSSGAMDKFSAEHV